MVEEGPEGGLPPRKCVLGDSCAAVRSALLYDCSCCHLPIHHIPCARNALNEDYAGEDGDPAYCPSCARFLNDSSDGGPNGGGAGGPEPDGVSSCWLLFVLCFQGGGLVFRRSRWRLAPYGPACGMLLPCYNAATLLPTGGDGSLPCRVCLPPHCPRRS
jgi:hypothetical protein